MSQSSKNAYMAYLQEKKKTIRGKGIGKKPLTSFEKLVLGLLLVFLISMPLAFFVNKEIMLYAGFLNYLILGFATTYAPGMIIDIMKKHNPKFEELYSDKEDNLKIGIRIMGIFFLILGIYFLYSLFG